MIQLIKPIFRKLGLRRDRAERWLFRIGSWVRKPRLFFCWVQNRLTDRALLCFPDAPEDFGYELNKICVVLGLRLTRESQRFYLATTWQDTTFREFSTDQLQNKPAYLLNSRCPNIGKDHVEEVFESVFGYSLRIDPTTYKGRCVRKSILNAKHDGVVMNCPIEKVEPGYVYQKLINNEFDEQYILDLRTTFFRDKIPLVYRKFRPIKTRFADQNDRVELARPADIYSPEEMELILKFCRAMQLDYGGVDVLRDRDTGKIYIVDVNTTPFGPPVALSTADRIWAAATVASVFQEQFVDDLQNLIREMTLPLPTPVESRQT